MKNYLGAVPYSPNVQNTVVTDEDMEADAFLDVVDVIAAGVTIKLPAAASPGKSIKVSAATSGGPVTIDGNGRQILGSGVTTVIEGATVTYYLSERNVWVPSISDLIHAIARLSITATNAPGPSVEITLDSANTFRCSIGTITVQPGFIDIQLTLDEPLPTDLQSSFLTLHVVDPDVGIGPFVPILVNAGPNNNIAVPYNAGDLPLTDPVPLEIHYLVMRIPIVI